MCEATLVSNASVWQVDKYTSKAKDVRTALVLVHAGLQRVNHGCQGNALLVRFSYALLVGVGCKARVRRKEHLSWLRHWLL